MAGPVTCVMLAGPLPAKSAMQAATDDSAVNSDALI